MNKLLKLINEYELEREKGIEEFKNWALPLWEWSIDDGDLVYDGVEPSMNLESAYGDTANGIVISKSYGFIKWLVDNDKIDVNKVKKEFYNNICITEYGDEDRVMGDDNLVIAVLSISDSPIKFLCSILK